MANLVRGIDDIAVIARTSPQPGPLNPMPLPNPLPSPSVDISHRQGKFTGAGMMKDLPQLDGEFPGSKRRLQVLELTIVPIPIISLSRQEPHGVAAHIGVRCRAFETVIIALEPGEPLFHQVSKLAVGQVQDYLILVERHIPLCPPDACPVQSKRMVIRFAVAMATRACTLPFAGLRGAAVGLPDGMRTADSVVSRRSCAGCRMTAAIKARWICEQAHQQLKEELGLDHFEGRSWTGLHRHALMTMIAYAFFQSRRLKAAGREKRAGGPPPQPSMPAIRQATLNLFAQPPPLRGPHCEKLLPEVVNLKAPK